MAIRERKEKHSTGLVECYWKDVTATLAVKLSRQWLKSLSELHQLTVEGPVGLEPTTPCLRVSPASAAIHF
ncbi:hypothetical protein FNL39_1071 [Nocardia caishijiensis]|uniref:Uncharacterized protein n=1 Tax=Nocardia caishijiensis TaxID=184756 RepID=A0ABQ6YIY4_9NOCA|nr:hypothetical protein FNL39_1071 [Nocardia caishijiensis]